LIPVVGLSAGSEKIVPPPMELPAGRPVLLIETADDLKWIFSRRQARPPLIEPRGFMDEVPGIDVFLAVTCRVPARSRLP
jgi:hypothetical protein